MITVCFFQQKANCMKARISFFLFITVSSACNNAQDIMGTQNKYFLHKWVNKCMIAVRRPSRISVWTFGFLLNSGPTTFPLYAQLLSHVQLFSTLWIIVCHAPLSMEFSRQEYWCGLPVPTPGDLPDPGIEPTFLASSALAGGFLPDEPLGKPGPFWIHWFSANSQKMGFRTKAILKIM